MNTHPRIGTRSRRTPVVLLVAAVGAVVVGTLAAGVCWAREGGWTSPTRATVDGITGGSPRPTRTTSAPHATTPQGGPAAVPGAASTPAAVPGGIPPRDDTAPSGDPTAAGTPTQSTDAPASPAAPTGTGDPGGNP